MRTSFAASALCKLHGLDHKTEETAQPIQLYKLYISQSQSLVFPSYPQKDGPNGQKGLVDPFAFLILYQRVFFAPSSYPVLTHYCDILISICTGQLRLERTSGGPKLNLLLKTGSALRSDEAAKDLIHLYLKNLCLWRMPRLSGQPLCPVACLSACSGFSWEALRHIHVLLVIDLSFPYIVLKTHITNSCFACSGLSSWQCGPSAGIFGDLWPTAGLWQNSAHPMQCFFYPTPKQVHLEGKTVSTVAIAICLCCYGDSKWVQG